MNLLTLSPEEFCRETKACGSGKAFAMKYATMAEVWEACENSHWLDYMIWRLRIEDLILYEEFIEFDNIHREADSLDSTGLGWTEVLKNRSDYIHSKIHNPFTLYAERQSHLGTESAGAPLPSLRKETASIQVESETESAPDVP